MSRSVTVQGRCPGPPPPGAPASLLPPGACVVDAGLRSRHFFVRPGGFLQLSSLALVGGTDLQGGSVLAVGGRFSARGCLFANNTGLGDGGSVLGVAGAAVSLESCAFLGSDSVGGLGGAAAAVGGSSLEAIECSFEQCSSQNGGAGAPPQGRSRPPAHARPAACLRGASPRPSTPSHPCARSRNPAREHRRRRAVQLHGLVRRRLRRLRVRRAQRLPDRHGEPAQRVLQ